MPFLAPEGRRVDVLGLELHVLERGEPAAPPLVLLHGGGPGCSSWTDFAPVVELLPGRRLLLVDFPQYGRSSFPHVDEPVFGFHARHVRALLEQLEVDRADFLCQSLGGAVALRLAADAPALVHRIVATGCHPVAPPNGQQPSVTGPAARAAYYDSPSPEAMRRLIETLEWFDGAAVPDSTVTLRHQQSLRQGDVEAAQEPRRRGIPEDLTERLGEVEADVLLLWGAHDPFTPPPYALHVAGLLPRADVLVLSRTSHHAQAERPRAYAAAVRTFLDPC
jgi:pimeloyl-ACP methyl ester carboxylesterase